MKRFPKDSYHKGQRTCRGGKIEIVFTAVVFQAKQMYLVTNTNKLLLPPMTIDFVSLRLLQLSLGFQDFWR